MIRANGGASGPKVFSMFDKMSTIRLHALFHTVARAVLHVGKGCFTASYGPFHDAERPPC